jgi:hypothetical protein
LPSDCLAKAPDDLSLLFSRACTLDMLGRNGGDRRAIIRRVELNRFSYALSEINMISSNEDRFEAVRSTAHSLEQLGRSREADSLRKALTS